MKTIHHTFKLFLLLVTGVFMSCQDMNEVHEEYIKDGEIIYTNKVDSLSTYSGKNRVKIKGYITGAFTVNEIVVSWNEGENQQVFPYEKSAQDTDSISLIVTELEENSYEFKVTSKDSDGNTSVPSIAFGTAYGERYRSNLEPRSINHVEVDQTDMKVVLAIGAELQRDTEIKFTTTSNEEVVVSVPKEETEVVLENISLDHSVHYRTYYVPSATRNGEETSIDQFESDWEELTIPAIGEILNNLQFTPVLGGVAMNWSNPEGGVLVFTVEYTVDGVVKTQTVTSSEVDGEAIISGMDEGEQTIHITLADAYGNSFGPMDYTVTPQPAQLLDKSAWTVIDFSSEEPNEGAPNGVASATIDGNVNSFWHTQWAGGSPGYPHYVTIDMGAEKTIASFETFRRQGDSRGQTKHQFLVSLDGETWTDLGTFNMDPTTNEGQVYAIPSTPTARYFKYVAVEGPNFYAFLGEINVYGLE
ncbi:DUF4998 domain-containing protein [Arenibacter amylolyticus]|uniref:DUF4998 domain-containing protein n=1 Tax=Arenibacter amylolyticus TaxID=1406873 RepID=UPI000A3B2197|nr:DUF4998 domain-containing protein [Arenibacter amylolyticus]